MALDGGQMLHNLENKCKVLKPGNEVVVQIRLTQKELLELNEVTLNNGCKLRIDNNTRKITIIKPSEEDDIDLDSLADELLEDDKKKGKEMDKRLAEKEKQVAQKEKQVVRLERLALMNPTRELEKITLDYKKKYYKNGKLDIDKYYEEVKKAHKAICLPSSYIDEDTYGLIIKGKFINIIINDVKKYHGEKIKKILRMLNEIKTKSKPKAYNMA